MKIRYLMVDACTSYYALLERSSLNKLGAIVSTPHLAMKFPTKKGEISIIHVDQRVARECHMASLKMVRELRRPGRSEERSNLVAMVDLFPRMNDGERMELKEEIRICLHGRLLIYLGLTLMLFHINYPYAEKLSR